MRRNTQKHLHNEEVSGDCWRTSLSCILDLDRDDVPHVIDDDDWWEQSVRFVEGHVGVSQTLLNLNPEFPIYKDPENAWQHVIAVGPSPRGDFNHCVVVSAITGDLVWDPHPDRTGLAGPPICVSAIGVLE